MNSISALEDDVDASDAGRYELGIRLHSSLGCLNSDSSEGCGWDACNSLEAEQIADPPDLYPLDGITVQTRRYHLDNKEDVLDLRLSLMGQAWDDRLGRQSYIYAAFTEAVRLDDTKLAREFANEFTACEWSLNRVMTDLPHTDATYRLAERIASRALRPEKREGLFHLIDSYKERDAAPEPQIAEARTRQRDRVASFIVTWLERAYIQDIQIAEAS